MAVNHNIFGRHKLTTSIAAGAAASALAIGGYANADAASSNGVSGGANAAGAATLQASSGGRPTPASTLPNATQRTPRANAEQTVTLTDHEQYVRHHQRLASLA